MTVRILIDKKQVETNIARATKLNVRGADFLLMRILEDLSERLGVIKRQFEVAHVITPWSEKCAPALKTVANIGDLELAMQTAVQRENDVLALAPASSDMIVEIANLHQVNDVPGMLVQYRRVLREDGLFLACVPGGDTLTELRQSLVAAEAEISGGVRPRVLPFMDVRDAGSLLQRAGFALPVTDVDHIVVRYDTLFDLMLDLRAMGATNTLNDRHKGLSRRDLFHAAAHYYAENFSDSDGRIRATFSFIWMSGWAPASTQPKPLRPGSATHSLAQALKDKSD